MTLKSPCPGPGALNPGYFGQCWEAFLLIGTGIGVLLLVDARDAAEYLTTHKTAPLGRGIGLRAHLKTQSSACGSEEPEE